MLSSIRSEWVKQRAARDRGDPVQWLVWGLAVGWMSLLFAGILMAQETTGSIRGTVLDPSGATVPGARVTATQAETGLVRTAVSDRQGAYLLVLLPLGHYRLEASAKGFQEFVQEGITLSVNQTAAVPIHLVVGSATQSVQVTANTSLIETADTTLGKTVGEREILDLPLNGRNFSQLGLLQPGVAPITPGLAQAGGSLRDGQPYSVNGQRPESNNFLIDGADNFNSVDGGFVLKPPIDAIAEFKILTHTANAEFGSAAGSTTNIVTRSGSNQFHGAAWEFLRNDALDAANFFENADGFAKSEYRQNQFGATLGGPIRQDKTFFFGYYEGFRNRQGETINHVRVPSLLERQGNFSQDGPLLDLCPNPPACSQPPAPFPNSTLPFIDPTAANVVQLYPLPNAADPNGVLDLYNATQILRDNDDQFGVRLDHYLSSRDTLNVRYMFLNGSRFDPLSTSGAGVPGFPVGEDHRTQNFVAQLTHSFSPSVAAVTRVAFLRNKFLFDEHLNNTSPASLGFQYQPTLGVAAGPPFIQFGGGGYASIGDPITGPRNTYENAYSASSSLTWIRGRHEMKFGGDYRRDQINAVQGIASNGFFVFIPFPVSNAFASFLIGQPLLFLQGGGDQPNGSGDLSRGLRGNALNFYAQDTYKATPRLTLNIGLRYDLPFPYAEIRNRQNLFEPGMQSQVMPDAPAGLLYPGDPGIPAGLIPAEKKAFAPRLGVAWDPTGSARWLIRAAYGIFYDPYYNGEGGPLQTPISAPPFLRTPQLMFPGNFSNPFANGNPFATKFSTPMTLLTLDPRLRLPYAQDWNLSVERSFGADWLVEIGYVGTKGTRLPRFIEDNPSLSLPGETWAGQQQNIDAQRLYCMPTAAGRCTYSSVGLISGIANSSYDALESSLRKRFGHGVSMLASYTYSKAIDDVSSFNITGSASQPVAGENDLAQNPFDLAAERGRSLFDARHRFVLSYEWALPFWRQPRTWYQRSLGDWQLNGITTFSSGTPFTVVDQSYNYDAPEITGFSSFRPNLIGNPNNGPKTPQEWFNTQAFQAINFASTPAGVYGSEGRNVVEGPGFAQWDVSAFKSIQFSESKSVQFRAELFNLFNRTNFRLPNSDISSPTFGQVQQALQPRLIQLALKFLF
ncbi:MAG TPA: TonB-dependent receptor [Terriglobia bacterium]|nr:TonB-dependent receptor [Terriglobia bacterium]